ncbi:hypothetical protein [Confluentibacter sediminis]|uniref:hypothetical protein n=1 Tax=Confluentibacter sediminis TaxID=2219045 RepID=UPI0013A6E273|nr:hypothetical protein [Confluentibacter sediminis]
MKLIQKTHSKRGAYILVAFIMLFSCNKDILENTVREEAKVHGTGTTVGYVTESDVPEVIDAITAFTGISSLSKTSSNKGINYKKSYIDIKRILKAKNKESITNYSFSITVEHAPLNEFYNLIVNEDAKGKLRSPYVIKYVVDDDALDAFLMNDKDFRYFKGKQYIMSFNAFFKDSSGILSKSSSTTSDCVQETGIDNTGNGGNGDFYDIPNDHPLKTDPNAYDYAPYEYGESYRLDFNTYGGTAGSTSYQDTVRDEQFPVNALTSQGYSQYAVNVSISSSTSITGVSITGYYNSQGSLISLTVTTFFGGGGSSTRIMTFIAWEPDDHLDKQSSTSKSQIDCAEIEGEIGVNVGDLSVSILGRLGISLRSSESVWLNTEATLYQILSIDNYLTANADAQGNVAPEAKAFGNEIVDSGVDNTLVTAFPFVKYPPNSNYATQYPKLTEYLKNQLPTINGNSTIINAIKKYTNLTTTEIEDHLKWGNGPTIRIEQLGSPYGKFKKSTDPNSLYLDIDLVNQLENTTPNSNLANAFAFLIGVTILHEYVHYGDYNYNGDAWQYPQEEGLLFENDVYGQSVWISNAEIILKNN